MANINNYFLRLFSRNANLFPDKYNSGSYRMTPVGFNAVKEKTGKEIKNEKPVEENKTETFDEFSDYEEDFQRTFKIEVVDAKIANGEGAELNTYGVRFTGNPHRNYSWGFGFTKESSPWFDTEEETAEIGMYEGASFNIWRSINLDMGFNLYGGIHSRTEEVKDSQSIVSVDRRISGFEAGTGYGFTAKIPGLDLDSRWDLFYSYKLDYAEEKKYGTTEENKESTHRILTHGETVISDTLLYGNFGMMQSNNLDTDESVIYMEGSAGIEFSQLNDNLKWGFSVGKDSLSNLRYTVSAKLWENWGISATQSNINGEFTETIINLSGSF